MVDTTNNEKPEAERTLGPAAEVTAEAGEKLMLGGLGGEEVKDGEEAEEFFETNWDMEVNKFDDMGLKEEVLRGIYAYGFKDPSPIQTKGILPLIQGKDTIA